MAVSQTPTADAAFPIMSAINSLVPAGRTPLTQGIETAAEALDCADDSLLRCIIARAKHLAAIAEKKRGPSLN